MPPKLNFKHKIITLTGDSFQTGLTLKLLKIHLENIHFINNFYSERSILREAPFSTGVGIVVSVAEIIYEDNEYKALTTLSAAFQHLLKKST